MINRTEEFHSAVKLFQKTSPESAQTDFSSENKVQEPSKFAAAAEAVSIRFKENNKLISQLEKLVRCTGCHNDPTDEISAVAGLFKQDIAELSQELAALDQLSNVSASSHSQKHRHYRFIVEVLKGVASEQTKKFQKALEQRTQVMRDQNERRKLYSHSKRAPMVNLHSPLFNSPPSSSSGNRGGVKIIASPPSSQGKLSGTKKPGEQFQEPRPTLESSTTPNPNLSPEVDAQASSGLRRRPLVQNTANRVPNRMVAQVQMQELQQNSQHRMEEAHAVERTIAELGTMMSKMATMVVQQGEIVQRIDDDLELAHGGIQAGHLELTRFYSIVKGNRSLIIKIFVTLMIFIFLFVVVWR